MIYIDHLFCACILLALLAFSVVATIINYVNKTNFNGRTLIYMTDKMDDLISSMPLPGEDDVTKKDTTDVEQTRKAIEEQKKRDAEIAKKAGGNVVKKTDPDSLQNMFEENAKTLTLESANPKVQQLFRSIDVKSNGGISEFGVDIQKRLDDVSTSTLETVETKDISHIGDQLTQLTMTMKMQKMDQKGGKPKGLFSNFLRKVKLNSAQMRVEYQSAQKTIENLKSELTDSSNRLKESNKLFYQMYVENSKYYHDIQDYIDAGTLKIMQLDREDIPYLQSQLKIAHGSDRNLIQQQLGSLESNRNRLSKRVYDLMLAQQVSFQQMPQLRILVADNNELIDKVQQATDMIIPLWKNQAVIRIKQEDTRNISKSLEAVSKMTNEMLLENAKLTQETAVTVTKQNQEGIIKPETLQQTGQIFIDTISQCHQIIQDGSKQREQAKKEMQKQRKAYMKQLLDVKVPEFKTLGE